MFSRRSLRFVSLTVVLGLAAPALAQTVADADRLNADVMRLYGEGKYAEAVSIAERVLAIREKTLGFEHPDVGKALNNLAALYTTQARYAAAEPLYKRSLFIREKSLGPDHPRVGKTLNNLARLYRDQGRYGDAEPLYKRTITILEKALGPDHPDVGKALGNLAGLYRDQGRYSDAEPLYKRTITIVEKALGPEHPDVATSLNNLAGLYQDQGRYGDAEPLYERAITIVEKARGPDHPHVGVTLNSLAALYHAQGRHGDAEPLFKRALSIREKALGPDHPQVGATLNDLAALYAAQGRYGDAESLYKRSVSIGEKALGPEHPGVGRGLGNLAGLYRDQGRYGDAEPLYNSARAILENALGPEHPDVATTLNNLAWLALSKRDFAGAAQHWRGATSIVQSRAKRGLGGMRGVSSKGKERLNTAFVSGLVKTTHRLAAMKQGDAERYAKEMFETAQWGVSSEAAASLAQSAARSAGGSPALAALVRERQDLVVEWQQHDKQLISSKSRPIQRRNMDAETALSGRLRAIDTRLAEIDAQLTSEFPDFAALASPKATGVVQTQAGLRDDEALVLFFDTDNRFPNLPEETFIWIVTKTEIRWLRSELGTKALQREVAALRCGLDHTAWYGEGALKCADYLKLPASQMPENGSLLPFDAGRAHALYKSLLGEADDLIKGKHLLLVPTGALTKLPFQVLVTEPPRADTSLNDVAWLARDHAITVLPSVSSLRSLRRVAEPSRADRQMIGFGNPLLEGPDVRFAELAKRAGEVQQCREAVPWRLAALMGLRGGVQPVPTRGGFADLAHLKSQTPLPETADELCAVARGLGADVRDLRLGANATEAEIKRLNASGDLARYRIVHFATHGTLAGQISGATEPGLILTPPETATERDDGYLSGSEIASLKLDAEWVILSACNTAGGSDETNAEALSGLARVFFYAGARALLVSHWEVYSEPTVKLITSAVRALSDGSVGRAEALRRAMLNLIDNGAPDDAHPSYWAPFVVVGEGALVVRR